MRTVQLLGVGFCLLLTACAGSRNTDDREQPSPLTTVENVDPSRPLLETLSQIPGVYVDDLGRISIRGSNRPPLVVLDGTELSYSDLSFISPADVDRIEVVKGPETAMYGLRGGGGVIVITTKRGHGAKDR